MESLPLKKQHNEQPTEIQNRSSCLKNISDIREVKLVTQLRACSGRTETLEILFQEKKEPVGSISLSHSPAQMQATCGNSCSTYIC